MEHKQPPQISETNRPHGGRWIFAGVLLLLVIAGPLFVCMPINSDTALFDVQADRVLKGGVLYRDIVEPNLPGIVWVHLAIRSVVGWSSEAIRFADLLIVSGILLVFSTLPGHVVRRGSFLCLSLLFYLGCNEWCHCQRDTWMLLPVSVAIFLRLQRIQSCGFANSPLRSVWQPFTEGLLWGLAFWLKPHVAIPAICVIAVAFRRNADDRWAWRQTAIVVLGGMAAAVPGIIWMVKNGAWPHFLDMMLNWNPEYLQAGRDRQSIDRWVLMFRRFYPWWCVHIVAIPLAAGAIRTLVFTRSSAGDANEHRIVLSALYLGWMLQSLALQHAMDYIHVPGIVLGLLVLCGHEWKLSVPVRRPAIAAFCVLAMLSSPMFHATHLSEWAACWREGSTSERRAALAHGNFPDWQHLGTVKEFLEHQKISDGELTCVNVHSVHLFRELAVQPATRYWCTQILQELFPSRQQEIEEAVKHSRTRFIVTESAESRVTGDRIPVTYPWNLPVVFQSGSYRVHVVGKAEVRRKIHTRVTAVAPADIQSVD